MGTTDKLVGYDAHYSTSSKRELSLLPYLRWR